MRFGTVALVGRTNVGKSSFLNAALGLDLAIVSPRPQTTRDALLAVITLGSAQVAFVDTPGLHRPRNRLSRTMNEAAMQAARSADVLLFMTDRYRARPRAKSAASSTRLETSVDLEDRELLVRTSRGVPTVLVLNKVDRLADKSALLPAIAAWSKCHDFSSIIPACVLDPVDVQRILDEVVQVLPEGPAAYEADTLTDRPTEFFVREYVREQVMQQTSREVVHAVAVTVEHIESRRRLLVASATLHVEKTGQRKILVGRDGTRIRAIGTAARERLEALLGCKVHLALFVRVTPRWKNVPRQLAELGYLHRDSSGRTAPTRGSMRRPRSRSRAK